MSIAYIGIGSNLGNSKKHVQDSLLEMELAGIQVIQVAPLIETAPYGGVEQPNFVNTVCQVETTFEPLDLLKTLKKIEEKMGRTPTVRWGPRLIDLDILLYEDLQRDEESLQIPHMDMLNRDFVLKPLAEIAPDVIHPISKRKISTEWELLVARQKENTD